MKPNVSLGVGTIDTTGKTFYQVRTEILQRAMEQHHGCQKRAALALGLPKSTMHDWAYRYKIGVDNAFVPDTKNG